MEKIKTITILGGGTAGWLSANYLNKALGPSVKISLIESSNVPTIGVGESTLPSLKSTLEFIGINEKVFLKRTNGTYKNAIKFVNWEKNPNSKGRNDWHHPFFPRNKDSLSPYKKDFFPYIGDGFSLTHYWFDEYRKHQRNDYDYSCFLSPHLCSKNKAPKESPLDIRYAYHIDAGLLAELLKEHGKQNGISHIIGHMENTEMHSNGNIKSIILRDGRKIQSDFFIDCSGFASLLIKKTLQEEFISEGAALFANAAVAIPAKGVQDTGKLRSYTTSTAMNHGWIWEVPLYHRNGAGYVYSNNFIFSR